jgi:hypothetical protein
MSRHDPTTKKLAAIRALAPREIAERPGALAIVLMNGNVEAFLRRIDGAQPNSLSRPLLEAALDKDMSARDQCFAQVARVASVGWRTGVRRVDDGFDCAVRYLACLATHEPWPPW